MSKHPYPLLLNQEALGRVKEIQDSIDRIALQVRPYLEEINRVQARYEEVVRQQTRFDELIRSVIQPSEFERMNDTLASVAATQKHLEEAARASKIFESMQTMSTGIAQSIASATAFASFHKFDALREAALASARLNEASAFFSQLEGVGANLASAFAPADLAYDHWRAELDFSRLDHALEPAAAARERFLATDLLGSLSVEPMYQGAAITARVIVVEEAEHEILLSLPGALKEINPGIPPK